MATRIFKYIIIVMIGIVLAVGYSFIINQGISLETCVVFFALYLYIIVFMKFLANLFK